MKLLLGRPPRVAAVQVPGVIFVRFLDFFLLSYGRTVISVLIKVFFLIIYFVQKERLNRVCLVVAVRLRHGFDPAGG